MIRRGCKKESAGGSWVRPRHQAITKKHRRQVEQGNSGQNSRKKRKRYTKMAAVKPQSQAMPKNKQEEKVIKKCSKR